MPPYRDKDDYKSNINSTWRPSIRVRRNKRTLVTFGLSILLLVYLVLNPPWSYDLEGEEEDAGAESVSTGVTASSRKTSQEAASPKYYTASRTEEEQTYGGPIKFYNLLPSLNKVNRYRSGLGSKRHVLFAASSMASASRLAGLACDMASEKRNTVHLVLVGRDEEPIQLFETTNKIGGEGCPLILHDGRPNSAARSTDLRMETSVRSVIGHINNYIGPSVAIVDNAGDDTWFLRAAEWRCKNLNMPMIRLPAKAAETLPWLKKLDTGSLSKWETPTIDIFIHANERSGNLIRLLKSIEKADYFGRDLPRIHIELGACIDTHVRDFLNGFHWPENARDKIFVRHRISGADTATSLVEGFYPSHSDNHILILDPDIELSPFYFNYLFYTILQYKYSSTGYQDTGMLSGISLHRPKTLVNRRAAFAPSGVLADTPFLYAAPDSYAALYFGDHWRQLHSYLTYRLQSKYADEVDYALPTSFPPTSASWLTYFMELSLARGYMTLYPPFSNTEGDSLVDYTSTRADSKNPIPEQVIPWDELVLVDIDGKKMSLDKMRIQCEGYRKKIADCKFEWKTKPGLSEAEDLFCLKRQRKGQEKAVEPVVTPVEPVEPVVPVPPVPPVLPVDPLQPVQFVPPGAATTDDLPIPPAAVEQPARPKQPLEDRV